MAMLLEGDITLRWENGFVQAEDEGGQRVCVRLSQFYRALEVARQFEATLATAVHREQCGRVVSLQPGCQLIRGEPV